MRKQTAPKKNTRKLSPAARQALATNKQIREMGKIAVEALRQMTDAAKAKKIKVAVAAYKCVRSAVDAAHEAVKGTGMTVAQLKALGYVKDKGGTWALPIPVEVCKALDAEERREKRRNASKTASKIAKCNCGCADLAPGKSVAFCFWCSHQYADYNRQTENDHFANHCPHAPEQLKDSARKSLAKRKR